MPDHRGNHFRWCEVVSGKGKERAEDAHESNGKWIERMAPAYSVGLRLHLRTASAASEMD